MSIAAKKRPDPSEEKHFLILLPEGEEGGRAIDLMVKDGRVYGTLSGDEPCLAASESQLKKLTRAGIKWSYATGGKSGDGNTKAVQPGGRRRSRRVHAA